MKKLTSRERILRTFRHQDVDRIAMADYPWKGTLQRWKKEGLSENTDWRDLLGFDKTEQILPDISPRFEYRVLEETDRYRIVTTSWGETRKEFKEMDSTPQSLDFYCNSSDRWEETKARMKTYYENRIPWDKLRHEYPKWKADSRFLRLEFWMGFDATHSFMTGFESAMIAIHEEPEWLMDVFDTQLTVMLDLFQKILDEGYEFDGIYWWDDMGYKGSTFFSPQTYRGFLKPYHKRACDWAHERGLTVELHSCGFIEPLIPDLIDIGVEMLNPLEIKAGMDPAKLKKLYGDQLAFHGGINAQTMHDPEKVRAEMERIIPLMMEGGGYVFACDHSIPNTVSLEQMKFISDLAHKLGTYKG
ncbi:MAG: hypothetical protein J6C26_03335 [Clostridia bacterium]|nr:hypothetical protein [Clostridia bacterium]